MIRYSGTVVFLDGRRQDFDTGARGGRAWEAYAGRHGLPITPTTETIDRFPVQTWQLVIAHAALGVELGVDAWLEDVDGLENWKAEDVPPTAAAPSTVSSSSSRLRSAGA